MNRLSVNFFNKNSVCVAKKLLGKIIVRRYNGVKLSGKIVEVESYRGKDDAGSHAFKKKTQRNSLMFGKPGVAYIYLCYGNHYLLNIVTEKDGEPGAVLIRAIEPVNGIKTMMKMSGVKNINNLTNGPGKLTKALGIDKTLNGEDVTKSKKLFFLNNNKKFKINSSSRIGIKKGKEKKWRFYIANNPFVSKY